MSRHKVFGDSDEDVLESGSESEETTTHTGKEEGEEELLVESESDSAPEDVTFTASKQEVLQQVKSALQQIEGERTKTKLKRKERDDKYTLQKKQKLEKLQAMRLPDDILDGIEEKSFKPKKKTQKKEQSEEDTAVKSDSDEDKNSISDSGHESEDGEADFIGFDSSSGIRAVPIKEELGKRKLSAQTAADFKQQRLYGGKVPRESVQKHLAIKIKKKARLI